MFHRRTCESKMWTIGDCGKQSVTLVTSVVQIHPFQHFAKVAQLVRVSAFQAEC